MFNTQDPERTNRIAARQAVTDLPQNLRQPLERQRERKPCRSVPGGSVAPYLGCDEPDESALSFRRPGSRQPMDNVAVKLLRKPIQHARVRAEACGPTLRPHRDRGLREPDATALVNQPAKPIRNRDHRPTHTHLSSIAPHLAARNLEVTKSHASSCRIRTNAFILRPPPSHGTFPMDPTRIESVTSCLQTRRGSKRAVTSRVDLVRLATRVADSEPRARRTTELAPFGTHSRYPPLSLNRPGSRGCRRNHLACGAFVKYPQPDSNRRFPA
jgi:hypothetical protein